MRPEQPAPGWAWPTALWWLGLAALCAVVPGPWWESPLIPAVLTAAVGTALGQARAWRVLAVAAGGITAPVLVAVFWIESGAAAAGLGAVRLPATLLLLDLLTYTLPLLTGACLGWLWRILREGLPIGVAPVDGGR
ncbi:hypothetical protein ACGFX4_02440 [Kitasatospora sp. NPDC048365]|uniref:hypothetical protein n=1 Tax=Kitasatospora sp. NPDC048365 TaxID=3364050 RepID=UPI003718D185